MASNPYSDEVDPSEISLFVDKLILLAIIYHIVLLQVVNIVIILMI